MTTRGRKPKPTHLKLVEGNPGKRPLNAKEAKVTPKRVMPPPHLSDEAKVEWGRVCDELFACGLLSGLDRAALAAYCQSYSLWVQAENALTEMGKDDPATGGLLIQTTNGNAIQNPLIGIVNKAKADMVRYAAEFGMTPSARSRISATPKDQEDPTARYFG